MHGVHGVIRSPHGTRDRLGYANSRESAPCASHARNIGMRVGHRRVWLGLQGGSIVLARARPARRCRAHGARVRRRPQGTFRGPRALPPARHFKHPDAPKRENALQIRRRVDGPLVVRRSFTACPSRSLRPALWCGLGDGLHARRQYHGNRISHDDAQLERGDGYYFQTARDGEEALASPCGQSSGAFRPRADWMCNIPEPDFRGIVAVPARVVGIETSCEGRIRST